MYDSVSSVGEEAGTYLAVGREHIYDMYSTDCGVQVIKIRGWSSVETE